MGNVGIQLTSEAEDDLASISQYTMDKWGEKQALKYARLLDACFRKIAAGTDQSKPVFPESDEICVCHCEHHCVFYLRQNKSAPIIIAILHERMDLIQRLRDRL